MKKDLNTMNSKNKTYNNKITKVNSSKNFRKKYINPFPIPNLITINQSNCTVNKIKNQNLNGSEDKQDNEKSSMIFSLKKIFNYYFNEFFPTFVLYYLKPIKGNLMVLSNNLTLDKNINSSGKLINQVSCVIVSDRKSIRTCWDNGFYGKGNLSRSEPNWTERIIIDTIRKNSGINIQKSNHLLVNNKLDSKLDSIEKNNSFLFISKITEVKTLTLKMKNEQWNKNLLIEISKFGLSLMQSLIQDFISLLARPYQIGNNIKQKCEQYIVKKVKQRIVITSDLINIEYLQLDLQEAFFLKYALNCISIKDKNKVLSIDDCWMRFRSDINNSADIFILKYVVYHYYRSRGWIVKEGLKYGVDYVLYQKGPVFSHSEYAISIIPVMEEQNNLNYVNDIPTIHEINCTNRVCNQVLKKLVYCYVIIPKNVDLRTANCLQHYHVYEIRMKRWNPDKTRD